MPLLISKDYSAYRPAQTVKVGDMEYKKVNSIDTRNYLDSHDNKEKAISYINAEDGNYTAYIEDDKVVLSSKKYYYPKTKELGGKVYHDIVSNTMTPDGTKIYVTSDLDVFSINRIKVTSEGEVTDYTQESRKAMIAKVTKPFKKLMSLFRGKKI